MDLLQLAARRAFDAPALSGADTSRTWGELDRDGGRLAAALAARGAAAGRTVATVLPNSPAGALALLAVPRTGAALAPLNPRLTAAELARALDVLDPALVVCDAGSGALARDAAGEGRAGRVVSLEALEAEAPGPASASVPGGGQARTSSREPDASREQPYAVLWTSGTSGRARGVALSGPALLASARASAARLALGADDRWYAALGFAHVGGLALITRAAALGASVVCTPRFDAETFSDLVDRGEVTHASLVPAMLRRVLDARAERPFPASFGCLLLGGAHAPRPLLDRALAAGVPVALTYGLTEATSQVATAPPDLVRREPGTVGAPLDGVAVRIADDGEIVVSGDTLALRYVGSDEPLTGPDGWLRTGDLGELDGEGHLWITGRRAERIVTGGVNVDPAEVEDVLRLHEGVADAAVVGLPDDAWGELVGAAVVRRPGAYPDPGELETLARERLTTAKIPRRWAFVEEVPRNANGKVERALVRALLERRAEATGPG